MIAAQEFPAQRLELKYLADESSARRARDFVRSHLVLDSHAAGQPDRSYAIHSVYLDSDQLRLCWETLNGNQNRFKLRVRFYDHDPASPVFLEIKRRQNHAILKQRAMVRRSAVPFIASGRLPEPQDILNPSPRQSAALKNFLELAQRHQARPQARVSYRREAWVHPQDHSVRVTMDRHVRCGPESAYYFGPDLVSPVNVFGRQLVIEIKYTNRFPDWFAEMVRVLGLQQCSAAKYVDGVTQFGQHALDPAMAARLERLERRLKAF